MLLEKRKTRSRQPLRVDELATLEEIVMGWKPRAMPDRHAAGCFCLWSMPGLVSLICSNVGKLDFEFDEQQPDGERIH